MVESPPTTSKLQLKYRKPSLKTIRNQVEYKSDPTELKKPHPSRLAGEAQMWNGLVPYTSVVDKNSEGISWE